MNKLNGTVSNIESSGSLSLVQVALSEETSFQAIVIESSGSTGYMQKGENVSLLFKETEVIIARKELHAISLQNRIEARITDIQKGKLISKLKLQTAVGQIESVIGTAALELLDIKKDDQVLALIKMNEIMLSK